MLLFPAGAFKQPQIATVGRRHTTGSPGIIGKLKKNYESLQRLEIIAAYETAKDSWFVQLRRSRKKRNYEGEKSNKERSVAVSDAALF